MATYKIGTHSGQFHLDEVLACFLLRTYIPEYKNCSMIRTRDPKVLAQCHTVIDVGGVYDPSNNRFDHHQKEFQLTFPGQTIRLSSAGLIYLHFGKQCLQNMLQSQYQIEDNQVVEIVYQKLYETFIKMVDGKDNGVEQYESCQNERYHDNTGLNARVARLNVGWNEKDDQGVRFEQAMALVGQEWAEQVKGVVKFWYPARPIVEQALKTRLEVHPSGQIIKLSSACPWKEFLYEMEKEMGAQVLFVIFQGDVDWRVQAVSERKGGFTNRKSLKKDWRGISNIETLKEVSKINDIVFCHASGFIGGALSYESTLRMAVESLESME